MGSSEDREYSYKAMEEEYAENYDQLERDWKKKEEKFATIKYRSKIVPRIITERLTTKVKRFKQKIR